MIGYVYLFVAIISEVIATNLLKATVGFTKLVPSVTCLVAYGICFYTLSKAINYMPLNVAYALWGAIGIVMITLFSVVYWKEQLNLPTMIGLGFILIGTILVNVFGTGH
ncbi:DMT family transporter [Enterococcus termitis]|jgi:small multidrug resistance pump|uniref:Quaternary ammonium transporter n=1 Tax=Enterococcus termitis TaxID=332950 RepID=A0A1E5GSU7_9ENTE|nr:multidrug efflux SMR transporter [Enterococcus termitis]OEG15773.1 quaternary ammonium transporter [Enterococcus termitis]